MRSKCGLRSVSRGERGELNAERSEPSLLHKRRYACVEDVATLARERMRECKRDTTIRLLERDCVCVCRPYLQDCRMPEMDEKYGACERRLTTL